MNEKTKKAVLIVDDEPRMCEILRDRFTDCNEKADCPYEFEVDIALSAAECIQKVRTKSYDVMVLDIFMEEETSGLEAARTLGLPEVAVALGEEHGPERPVMIVFTGHRPSYRQCVEAMRYGAWDYIVKEDVGDTPMAQIVVDSALARLQQLDLRRELEQRIAADWLPRHLSDLQPQYGRKLVAIWHQPEIRVIASGSDAFELETNLKEWRKHHAAWEQPFLVRIPPRRGKPAYPTSILQHIKARDEKVGHACACNLSRADGVKRMTKFMLRDNHATMRSYDGLTKGRQGNVRWNAEPVATDDSQAQQLVETHRNSATVTIRVGHQAEPAASSALGSRGTGVAVEGGLASAVETSPNSTEATATLKAADQGSEGQIRVCCP